MPFNQQALNRLRKQFSDDVAGPSLDWYYKTGELVSRMAPKTKDTYRTGITALAKELAGDDAEEPIWRKRQNQLFMARHVYESLESDELKEFRALSWSSVELLLRVRLRKERKKLLRACVEQKWGIRELRRAVLSTNGEKTSQARGIFKDIVFPDVMSVAEDISTTAGQWLHRHECWFGPEAKLNKTSLKGLDRQQKDALRDAYNKLDAVAAALREAKTVLASFSGTQNKGRGRVH